MVHNLKKYFLSHFFFFSLYLQVLVSLNVDFELVSNHSITCDKMFWKQRNEEANKGIQGFNEKPQE